ncbi:PstS family phosphate ABC transporter substrate-binding protein [Desertivirga xinjiangensis]|uniref:PstS family phosphate ABC transporter substrate-binding protein n=1 Tax=Desertivirga xinjiangensis TaxID=539206 RepID=UPI00210B5228|nr:substrate-binding domain-containing protein [Pedobacter xinjiangensis]
MMRSAIAIMVVAVVFLASCGSENSKKVSTPTSGVTQIVVDESFAPIVQDQWDVFTSSYPEANIHFTYKPERELLNSFLNDSVRIAIMSRELLPSELASFKKKNRIVRTNRFAVDAVALISNKSSLDSTITVQEIIDILKGGNSNKSLVFDNANSSTVRYLKELSGVAQLPAKGVYALRSNTEVIKYVHNNIGSIGVIGVNWIKFPGKEIEPLEKEIRILGVKNLPGKSGSDKFYKPSQNNLALDLYPLSRGVYIINCQGTKGLGTGFASFLASERGQRIVLKSGLLPDSLPSREIIIR